MFIYAFYSAAASILLLTSSLLCRIYILVALAKTHVPTFKFITSCWLHNTELAAKDSSSSSTTTNLSLDDVKCGRLWLYLTFSVNLSFFFLSSDFSINVAADEHGAHPSSFHSTICFYFNTHQRTYLLQLHSYNSWLLYKKVFSSFLPIKCISIYLWWYFFLSLFSTENLASGSINIIFSRVPNCTFMHNVIC